MKNLLFLILLSFLFNACVISNPGENREVFGLQPIYLIPELDSVMSKAPREFNALGNIVNYKSYIYVIEDFVGVHVINNTDPSNPENISFINIPGVTQITIDDDILFANFWQDLILIDISSPTEVAYINTIEDFYPLDPENAAPQNYSGSFECPDLTKGIIVEWENAQLFDPQCWREF